MSYNKRLFCEIWGSHGGEYEDDCLQGDHPDDGGSKNLRNVGKLLPDYTAQQTQKTVILYVYFVP
jgi:hypothetical protein